MMTTPWGEIEVSDAHVHFFSPPFFHSLAEQKGSDDVGSILGWEVPESPEYLADRWVVEFESQQRAQRRSGREHTGRRGIRRRRWPWTRIIPNGFIPS